MRKLIISILLFALMCNLSACNIATLPENQTSETVREKVIGDSLDNLVPFGDYANIVSENYEAQIKITEIIRGEDANDIIINANRFNAIPTSNQEYAIIKFNIKVSSMMPDKTFSTRPFKILCNNGTLLNSEYSTGSTISEFLGMTWIGYIKFAAEGSVDTFEVFLIDKDQDKCLLYDGSPKKYFALL